MRHLIADFDAGQKSSSRRSPWSPFLDSFRVADKPGLETLTTLGTKTRSGQGYVMRLCRTRPKEVSECTWERFLLTMSSTRIPSTVNASAMRERGQRQGTASAHINALRFCPANLISLCNPASNSEVCM